ncbi:tumor necrosis factor-like [Discoglossus pictus]
MSSVNIEMESELLNGSKKDIMSRSSCWRWISICSFLLLLGTTVFLALLYFQIIPSPEKTGEIKMPEILAVRTYIDSLPKNGRGHLKAVKKLASHCPGHLENAKLMWEESSLMDSELEGTKIKLKDNSLVIPRDGLYFVYTQVAFTGLSCPGTKTLYLTHTVNKWSPSYEELVPILTSTKSVCEVPSSSAWFRSIYQGGLVYLEKGDVLSTDTTELKHLDEDPAQVYFGVLAV